MLKTSLRITLFCDKFNSLSQRVAVELGKRHHLVEKCEISHSDELLNHPLSKSSATDLIICPFLTKRMPEEIYKNTEIPCLIVHPGIKGDRGVSSIDWALWKSSEEWGVTVLQADQEMDAGDIWSTHNFQIQRKNINTLTKSSLYLHECTENACKGVLDAVDKYLNDVPPTALDYSDPDVKGSLQPNMKNKNRKVDWNDTAENIARKVRMSDTQPGAIISLNLSNGWSEFRGFGAHLEQSFEVTDGSFNPGDIVGHRNGAVLIQTGSGLLWLSHLKRDKLKLPAMMWLHDKINEPAMLPPPKLEIKEVVAGEGPRTFQEIWYTTSQDGIAYLHFNFYNGAMSTHQCQQLLAALTLLDNSAEVKMVVLMGGYNYFSNGIHLNVIEASKLGPEQESWMNINAINDVVFAILFMSKPTISAVGGNAGAGGCMMALASDHVWARSGVVMTPSYKAMNLYGSEYHSFLLENRVGAEKARALLSEPAPLGSEEALDIGLFDKVFGTDVTSFREHVAHYAGYVLEAHLKEGQTTKKHGFRKFARASEARSHELEQMMVDFRNPEYHDTRKKFVYH